MDMSKMGSFLQVLRKEQGLTQEQLGEKLHISGKTISRWETGTYMPPVEMLLALSELYGVSMNELVAGERLTPEELPVKAEENLTAVMKDNAAFQLEERRDYWREKWLTDHRWTLALLVGVFAAASLLFLTLDLLKPVVFMALLSMGLAVFLRNRRDDYVEHHLYDDMLE
ncbi:MAG: helix-turn-helix transcriptional regulator [Clostridia bacterium]|nr:helix-turn-helix transcriptional regulator [Clostridia bacterium]